MVMTTPTLFPMSGGRFDPSQKRVRLLRDQPTYRVSQNATACSTPELLSALIGGQRQIELADRLLARFGGDLRRLHQAPAAELVLIPGITSSMAARIKAGLTLGIRLQDPVENRPNIHSPADAAALVQHEMGLLEKEHLRVMLLNIRNQVLDIVEVYQGSVSSAQVRIAEVLRPAVQRMAPALIVLHNHPSQDPSPSPDDVALTRAMVQAAKLLDLDLLDHLVICQHRFVSLKERGLGFS
jgi:DNA repair protein RadC